MAKNAKRTSEGALCTNYFEPDLGGFLCFFLFIQVCEDSGEDGSANGVVGAADGAWDHAEGGFRVNGEILRVGKECASEDGGHACVLHADFDGNGALLGGVELEQATDIVTEHVTEGVMQKHHSEHERDKPHAVRQKLRAHSHDHAADNQCEADDAHGRHICLEFLESRALAEEVVASESDGNRENRHVKDVEEHADGVHFDARVGKPKH